MTLLSAYRQLLEFEAKFVPIYKKLKPINVNYQPQSFAYLMRIIISQQLSTKASATIAARLAKADLFNPATLADKPDSALRACGLSARKCEYVRALLAADLDYKNLAKLADAQVVALLCAIKGIGTWSANIYLLFAMRRPDIWIAGDLGLQVAVQHLYKLPARPSAAQTAAIAANWQPQRSAACHLLWKYYQTLDI